MLLLPLRKSGCGMGNQRGFSLVEIFIGAALSAGLLMAITSVTNMFTRSQKSATESTNYIGLINDIRLAIGNEKFCEHTNLVDPAAPIVLSQNLLNYLNDTTRPPDQQNIADATDSAIASDPIFQTPRKLVQGMDPVSMPAGTVLLEENNTGLAAGSGVLVTKFRFDKIVKITDELYLGSVALGAKRYAKEVGGNPILEVRGFGAETFQEKIFTIQLLTEPVDPAVPAGSRKVNGCIGDVSGAVPLPKCGNGQFIGYSGSGPECVPATACGASEQLMYISGDWLCGTPAEPPPGGVLRLCDGPCL